MSNIFKSGIPGIHTIDKEPFIIDTNNRVIEPPKKQMLHPVVRPQTESESDTFTEGITQMADEIETESGIHEELLNDALDKAKMLQDDARERAAKIIGDAQAEADSIRESAREEGFAKGLEEGNMEAMRRTDEYLEHIHQERDQAIAAARQEMTENVADTEKKILNLACRMIEKLTGIIVEDYKPVMLYMINQVLNDEDTSRKFVIRVSEEQYSYIADNRERLSGAANPSITIEVFGDSKLKVGQCQIESETGIVDLSMDVQVQNLITAIKLLSES